MARNHYLWNLCRTPIHLGQQTAIMGILNVTPDSFSDGGRYFDHEKAIARGKEIEQQGADVIDIGGESSRPGSDPVSEDEEVRRVLPVIEALVPILRIPISVDTYRASVAQRAIEAGAQIVNDISAFRFDDRMPSLVADMRAGIVLMHSRGARAALHRQSRMSDPVTDVVASLGKSAEDACAAGVRSDAIVLDPGIGFGKAAAESLEVLKSLDVFSKIGYPLMVGTSRKSFIRTIAPETRESIEWGTAATVVSAILKGAHIVRVHDVKQARVLRDVTDRL